MIKINLLPGEDKKLIAEWVRRIFFAFIFGAVLFSILVYLAVLLTAFFYLKIQTNALDARFKIESQSEAAKRVKDLEDQLGVIRDRLETIDSLRQKLDPTIFFFTEFNSLVPEEARINSFVL